MTYDLSPLQNATSFPATILALDQALGGVFIMGVLILINLILFFMIYRNSGLRGAVPGSVFPVVFMAALLFPLGLISQVFFFVYLALGLIAFAVLIWGR